MAGEPEAGRIPLQNLVNSPQGQVFAVEFDLSLHDQQTLAHFEAKIRLTGDFSWRMVKSTQGNIRKVYRLPESGTWHVAQATPLPQGVGITSVFRGTLILNVANLVGVAVFLGDFFPANTGKTGRGTATGGRDGYLPTSNATYTITLVQGALGGFQEKFLQAIELAKPKIISKLGPAVYAAIKDPVFITLAVAHLGPDGWFLLLRQVGGKVLALWTLVQLAYQINAVLMDIDSAQTPQQLQAAGETLADILANLAAQALLQKLLEVVRNYREAKASPHSEERNPPAPPAREPMPAGYRSWRDGIHDLETKIARTLKDADPSNPADYFYKLERAWGYRIQIAWWHRFIIETAHHIEWLGKAQPEVQKYAGAVRQIVNKYGGTFAGYTEAIKYLKQEMQNAGLPFNHLNDERFLDLARALDLCGHLDWSMHDMESWLTTKFNEVVSQGLKNPFPFRDMPEVKKFTKDWKEAQYRKAAEGWDPRPGHEGQRLTDDDIIAMFGPAYGQAFLRAFGSPGEIFKGMYDAEVAYKTHNMNSPANNNQAPAHHQPSTGLTKVDGTSVHPVEQQRGNVKIFDRRATNFDNNQRLYQGMIEKGVDTAHAMIQLRLYRLFFGKVLSLADVALGERDARTGQRQPPDIWTLFGVLVYSKFKISDVTNPGTVSPDFLNSLGMQDLIPEARKLRAAYAH